MVGGGSGHSLFRKSAQSGQQQRLLRTLAKVGAVLALSVSSFAWSAYYHGLDAKASPGGIHPALRLPWAVGETWTLTQGPHNWAGTPPKPWSSLDLSGSSGQVRAAAPGRVHIISCSGGSYVTVDHGGGWYTGYYHISSIVVSDGQWITSGQYLGQTGTEIPCGGHATGPHVHFTVFSTGGAVLTLSNIPTAAVDLDAFVLGGWTISDGTTEGSGCMTRLQDGYPQCPGSGLIYNGGYHADIAIHFGTSAIPYLSTGSNFTYGGSWTTFGAIDWMGAGDFNGDGRDDIVIHDSSQSFIVYTSTGSSFTYQGAWVHPVGAFDHAVVADFNGDGKADIAIHDASNKIYVYLSTGTSFTFAGAWAAPVGTINWMGAGDFNGDGKDDIVIHDASNQFYVYTSTGSSLQWQGSWAPVSSFDHAVVGDFNGDGKSDVAIHDASSNVFVYTSTGSSFQWQGSWAYPVGTIDLMGAGDFNSDGKSDVVIHDASNHLFVYTSTGSSLQWQGSWAYPVSGFDHPVVGDFNAA
jgi:peptidase M23-like protein/VCBS repeat protein